jgi:hypothetical protein
MSNSYAQDKKIKFGITSGVNLSTFTNPHNSIFTSTPIIASNFGVIIQRKIINNFSATLGLGAIQKGGFTNNTFTQRNTYLNIPFQIRYTYRRFFLETGVELDYLVFEKITPQGFGYITPFSFATLIENKFDIGLNGGFGFHLSENTSLAIYISKGIIETGDINMVDENGTPIGIKSGNYNLSLQLAVTQLF